jgi:FkbM family methyltransferase
VVPAAVPIVRTYVRWAPGNVGKRAIVGSVVEPRLARRPHAFRARTIHGTRLRGDHQLIMPRCIYWFGVWEPLLTRWVEDRLQPGDTFVDVGANIGYFTLLAARTVGASGTVISFEPAPPTFAKLSGNLALNEATNVRPVQAAVGARAGRIPFYRAPWNDAENSTIAKPGSQPAGEVDTSPLAALLTDAEVARTRLIKVDIEGGEWAVLDGLAPDVERFPSDMELVIEVHPDRGGGRTAKTLADAVAAHGFTPSWLPVDFGAVAHLDRRPPVRPVPGLPPPDELVHLILSRQGTG